MPIYTIAIIDIILDFSKHLSRQVLFSWGFLAVRLSFCQLKDIMCKYVITAIKT